MKTRYLVLIIVALIVLGIGFCVALHFTIKPKAATPNDSSYKEIDEAITKGKDKENEKSSSKPTPTPKPTATPKPTTKKEEVTPSPKREESANTEDQSNAKVEESPADNSTGKNYDYYYGDGGGSGTNYDYYYGYDSGSYSWTNYEYYYN
ncbi:MAG: hypothetical protein IJH61_02040 [Eubacteriaceae bacterium]|nr:hypothetical protein [Eubacteriaceae bacterium]